MDQEQRHKEVSELAKQLLVASARRDNPMRSVLSVVEAAEQLIDELERRAPMNKLVPLEQAPAYVEVGDPTTCVVHRVVLTPAEAGCILQFVQDMINNRPDAVRKTP